MSDDEWIGSSTAKQRLHSGGDLDCRRYLGLDYAREFPVIYSNCDQGLRIDIDAGLCEWDVSNPALNRDMEIHFGFDEDMNSQCIYDVDHVNITSSQRYILVPYPFNGFDAQLFCEQHFDTSLAMIVTDENLQEALDLRYSMGLEEYDMWIGLHKSIGHDASSWHWYTNDTDAMWCDYTTYDGCIFDTHWVMSVAHDDADEVQSQCAAMVGYADTFEAYTAYSCGDEKPFLCDRHNSVEDVDPNAQTCDVFIENEIVINMYNATAGIDHNIIVMINTMVNITRTICTICHADDSTNCVACLDGIQLQPDLTLDGERSYIRQNPNYMCRLQYIF
eukprot:809798_1